MEDGSVLQESKQIHKKPILKLRLMDDQKTIITVSKDRNISAYDYIS